MRTIDELPEIDFIEATTIEDIREQMVNDYKEEYGKLTGKELHLSGASPYMLIINAAALQIYQLMQYVNNAAKMNLVKYSKGDFLDNLVAFKGLSRKGMEKASTVLRFSIDKPLEFAVSIPEGTRVTDGN